MGDFTSAPSHTTLSVQQFLTKCGMTPVPDPPYSADLIPSDSFLCVFAQMKKSPQRETFCNVEEVKQKTAEALKGIKIDELKNCFEQWKKMSQ